MKMSSARKAHRDDQTIVEQYNLLPLITQSHIKNLLVILLVSSVAPRKGKFYVSSSKNLVYTKKYISNLHHARTLDKLFTKNSNSRSQKRKLICVRSKVLVLRFREHTYANKGLTNLSRLTWQIVSILLTNWNAHIVAFKFLLYL